MIYFTSDWHFNHSNVIRFERNQFKNIIEHDNKILESLSVLTKDDTLWFLGDLGWPDDLTTEKIKRLPCTKYMIKGNHDDLHENIYEQTLGLTKCYTHPVWLTDRIVLSHYPIPVEDGVINVHGHLHGSVIDKKNYVNANIHLQSYELLPKTKCEQLLGSLSAPDYDYMMEWYADIQKPVEPRVDRILYDNGRIAGTRPYKYDSDGKMVLEHKRKCKSSLKAKNINKRLIGKWIKYKGSTYRITNCSYYSFITDGPVIYYDDKYTIKTSNSIKKDQFYNSKKR